MRKVILIIPLLFLYLVVILFWSSDELSYDEPAFLNYAKNLSKGFYTHRDNPDLTKPPLYPLILLPFVILKAPLLIPRLMNAFFLFAGILYFFHTLLDYTGKKKAAIFTYLMGVYPPLFPYIPCLIIESLTLFFLCSFIFHYSRFVKSSHFSKFHFIISALFLACLAMTKIIFGYVILTMICLAFLAFLLLKKKAILRSLLVFVVALAFCVPYLSYTYSITGKIFYWGTNGGDMLYWMSTPHPKEYGDWHMEQDVLDAEKNPELHTNHGALFEKLSSLPYLEKDKILKQKALENILSSPGKYLLNWLANLGRLVFNYPYSYASQTLPKYIYLIPNAFLFVISFLLIYPTYIGRKKLPFEITFLSIFAFIYLGGNSLVSAYPNYFIIIVPIIVFWLSFILTQVVSIEVLK